MTLHERLVQLANDALAEGRATNNREALLIAATLLLLLGTIEDEPGVQAELTSILNAFAYRQISRRQN